MEGVHEWFREVCAQGPSRACVVSDSRRWTYAEVDELSARIAGGLVASGVRPGQFVPVFLGRSAWFVPVILGILRAGAAYVPIDPTYPEERRRLMVRELNAPLGIGGAADAPSDSGLVDVLHHEALAGATASNPVEVGADSPAYVMYTSGSTGRPKGAVVPHRGIVRLVRDADFADFGPERVWALLSSVAFDASTLEIWGALLNGGACAVVEDRLPSIDSIGEFFARHAVTDAWFTAALFNATLDYRPEIFQRMRQVVTGGETESPRHFRRFLEVCPGVRLIHGYGPTENTTFSLCHSVGPSDVVADERIPIGRAIRGTDILLMKPDGAPAEPGQEGELYVGGKGVALGYLNQPEQTRQKFVHVPGRQGLWYRTGDLVRPRADGAILFIGRVDRQVKIRGHRIEPEEVEKLGSDCPHLSRLAVDVVGDSADTRTLVAYCVTAPGVDPKNAAATITSWFRERLPSYMVPSSVRIVDDLPRTTNGKVDRARLAELHASTTDAAVPEAQSELASIWRTLLPGARITDDADFFVAGGHSVLVLRMVAEVRVRMGRVLRASQVYRERTLAGVERALRESPSSVPEADRPAHSLLVPAGRVQQGLIYEWHRDPSTTAYHVFAAFVADRGFDRDVFSRALRRSIEAHPILRSVVEMQEGAAFWKVGPVPPMEQIIREHADVSLTDGGVSPAALEKLREPFDLLKGPLIRAHLFRVEGGKTLVCLVVQHAIVDEWSLDMLLAELGGAPLTEEPIAGYHAAWESSHLDHEEAHRRADRFAADVHAGYDISHHAHADGARAHDAVEWTTGLGSGVAPMLERRAAELRTSEFVLLLAAYAVHLCREQHSATTWIVTPFASRGTPELARVFGCCIDMRLLRVRIEPGDTFASLVARLHEVVLQEHDRGPVPVDEMARLVRVGAGVPVEACMRYAMTYRVGDMRDRRLGGVRASAIRVPARHAKFGTLAAFGRSPGAVELTLEAETPAQGREAVRAEAERLRATVDQLLSDSDAPVPISSQAPRQAPGQPDQAQARQGVVSQATGPLQEVCERCWRAVLGTATADTADDFFSAGGTSLMLIRLVAELRRETGRRLNLSEFVVSPCLGRLPGLLREDVDSSVHTFDGASEGATLVVLPGNFGPAEACVTLWRAMREREPHGYEFAGVDLRGLRGPGVRFEDVMARLTAEINAHVRGRRLTLVGSSLGGIAAFDLAGRLSAQGVRPSHVWLLDSFPPEARGIELSRKIAAVPWVAARAGPQAALQRFTRRLGLQRSHAKSRTSGEAAPDLGVVELDSVERAVVARMLLRGYRPPVVECPVTLVRSVSRVRPLGTYFRGSTGGWGRFTQGGVDVVDLNLVHGAFMSKRGAPRVAALIAPKLRAGAHELAAEPRS